MKNVFMYISCAYLEGGYQGAPSSLLKLLDPRLHLEQVLNHTNYIKINQGTIPLIFAINSSLPFYYIKIHSALCRVNTQFALTENDVH